MSLAHYRVAADCILLRTLGATFVDYMYCKYLLPGATWFLHYKYIFKNIFFDKQNVLISIKSNLPFFLLTVNIFGVLRKSSYSRARDIINYIFH